MYYNDTYLKQENKAVVPGTQNRYQLQDLTPNTVYTIKVSALSEKGEGAATRIIQAITQDFGMYFFVIPCIFYKELLEDFGIFFLSYPVCFIKF